MVIIIGTEVRHSELPYEWIKIREEEPEKPHIWRTIKQISPYERRNDHLELLASCPTLPPCARRCAPKPLQPNRTFCPASSNLRICPQSSAAPPAPAPC